MKHDIEADTDVRLRQLISGVAGVTSYGSYPVVIRLAGFEQIEHYDMSGPHQGSVPRFNSAAEIEESQVLDRGKCVANISQRRIRALAPREVGDSTNKRRIALAAIGPPDGAVVRTLA